MNQIFAGDGIKYLSIREIVNSPCVLVSTYDYELNMEEEKTRNQN